jgi:two-component system, OmpR family, sensor kinase
MSLRVRMLAAFGYVLVFALIALEIPLTLNFSRRVDSEIRSEASAAAQAVAAAASGRLTTLAPLNALAHQQAIRIGGRVLIVDSRGHVLVDSDGSPRGTSYASRPEIASALRGTTSPLRGTTSQGERHSNSLNADLLFTAVPIVDAGHSTGAVRITQSVQAVHHQVRKDVLALLALGGAVLLLGLGLAWALAGSLSRPLRNLAATARRVSRGDLRARAEPAGSSEQIELANAFNDMTERLVRTLDAQRDFVADASHQLRTPLTGLQLRLEAASMKAADADLRRDLAAGEHETERLAKLLTNLLRLAQDGQRPAAVPVGLGAAAGRASERWRDPAQLGGHEIEVAGAEEVEVSAAAGDLDTILDHLIENALNYGAPDTPIRLEWGDDRDGAFVAVLDRGPGLREDEIDRVFHRFYRGATTGSVSGTGLGLAIVESLARRWGARATLLNRPAGGTRAEVRFPLHAARPAGRPEMATSTGAAR